MKFDFKTVCDYAWPFVKAILLFVIGHYVLKGLLYIPKRALNKTKLDKSLINILVKSLEVIGNAIIIISALNIVGIPTTGLLAALSAVAVGIALALKDSLSNIAGGILLLVSPRFVTGDYIGVDGDEGFVTDIHLLHTTIKTYDNRKITFSNGVVLNSKVTNFTWEGKRRIDMQFPVSYSADVEKAKSIIKNIVANQPCILSEEEGQRYIRVGEYKDSSVIIHVYVWIKQEDYWDVYYDLTEQIREKLQENAITIPFNQLDVHIDNK